MEALQVLKKYWGYDHFRPLQADIIGNVLKNNDTLALLPTGGGKSLCYQVPALINDGFCLVISPLIALMQDQVARLTKLGIPAVCLHAGMHYNDVKRTLENMIHGPYKLLYVSPERLQTQLFRDFLPDFNISLIAVDEAHSISQWGYDFRPDYLKIASLRDMFTGVPVIALTASATGEVQQDIVQSLKLQNPAVFKYSFRRENIFYNITYSENKSVATRDVLPAGKCSIIYCRSRKQTEILSAYLSQSGIRATPYHARIAKDKREAAQISWMENKVNTIVATTAFGMGIDKPDVRMVLHYDAPEHLEAYYQEAGRAGRDGLPANAITLYNSTDLERLQESIRLNYPSESYLRQIYQSVVEYLQVGIGMQPDAYYPFDLYDFCKKFNFQALQAAPALRLLQQEGLWTLTEAVFNPATLHFTTDRRSLDAIGNNYPNLGYIATGLLRIYGTVFHYPTPIRIGAVAKQLRLKQEEIEQAILQLQQMDVVEYNRPTEGPQLFFHHYRVDSRHLIINLSRIATLRKKHEDRTNAMITFLENQTICREKIILQYFGEQTTADCGHCDICRKNHGLKTPVKDIRAALIQQLSASQPVTIKELVSPYQSPDKENALHIIRTLIDNNTLTLNPNGTVQLMNK